VSADTVRTDTPEQKESVELAGAETVLIVEDNEQVRELACAILQRHGYSVLVAGDGPDAIKIFTSHVDSIDLLLTDVVLPDMNGKAVYEKLAELSPGLRVLYMSGYTDNVIVHRGVLQQGVDFIQKPFNVQALAAKVREVLDRS
jgi:two-component system, cell cycle sensor histidine kinase and response regulator CckA